MGLYSKTHRMVLDFGTLQINRLMNRVVRAFFLLYLLLSGTGLSAQSNGPLPLVFVANEGQWEAPFYYKGISSNADIYLEQTGITYVVGATDNLEKIHDYKEGKTSQAIKLQYHAYRMRWLQTNERATVSGSKKQNYYHNYFIGNDSKRWKGGVSVY